MPKDSDTPSLKEYLMHLIATEHHARVAGDSTLEALLIRELEHVANATELAAAELARRLELLNHTHEQSLQDRSDFVTKFLFNTTMQRIDDAVKEILERRTTFLTIDLYDAKHRETQQQIGRVDDATTANNDAIIQLQALTAPVAALITALDTRVTQIQTTVAGFTGRFIGISAAAVFAGVVVGILWGRIIPH